jgi:thiamine biosynthesis lipoprotein
VTAVVDRPIVEARFGAMGTTVHVVVVGGDVSDAEWARARIEELEQAWSRFRPDSELSRLGAADGRALAVSADTRLLVRRSLQAYRATGGAFDPGVLGDLVALGYDRSYEQLDGPTGAVVGPCVGDRRLDAVIIDDGAGTVQFPIGLGFDPGGIGKGLAADLVTAGLLERGAAGACVNLGGDVRVRGEGPPPMGWQIGVEHPRAVGELLAVVGLTSGAVATSSRLRRTWTRDGRAHHHLIDPTAGTSLDNGLDAVTVVAGEGWWAEVVTKAAFVAGPDRAAAVIHGLGATGLFCTADGMLHELSGLADYLG